VLQVVGLEANADTSTRFRPRRIKLEHHNLNVNPVPPRDSVHYYPTPFSSKHKLSVSAPDRHPTSGGQVKQYDPHPAPQGNVVQRPVPRSQIEDPREFQVGQMRRRFGPSEQVNGDVLVLSFQMAPSDPDFPFDISTLDC
jgi:hypothetical protein